MRSKSIQIYEVRDAAEVERIERQLGQIPGLRMVRGDHKTKIFTFQWAEPATLEGIVKTLREMGYQPAYR